MPDGAASVGRDWLAVIRRRGWVIAQVTLVVLLAAVVASRLQPSVYSTQSTIVIYERGDRGRGGNGLDGGRPELSAEAQVDLIESQSVLAEVADLVGLGKTRASFQALRDQITPRVRKPGKGMTSVLILVEDRDPQRAADIATTAGRAFVDQRQEDATSSTTQALEHINKLVTATEEKLQVSEDTIQRFKETGSPIAATSDAGGGTRVGNYAAAESRLADMRLQIARTQAELTSVNRGLGREPEFRERKTRIRNPMGESLRQRIMELELERSDLIETYTEESDEVRTVDARLKAMRDALAEEAEQVTDQIAEVANQTYEGLTARKRELETQLKALETDQRGLSDLLAKRLAQVKTLPADETVMTRMLRELRVQEQIYTMLLQQQYEMEIAQMGQPVVAELLAEAPVPTVPSKPNRQLYAALGLVAGVLLGLIIAGLVDQLDDTFADASDVERLLDTPVLGMLPVGQEGDLPVPLLSQPGSTFAEAVRSSLAALQATWGDSPPRSLVVTAPESGEGKSMVAANLAVALAETGRRVLLVDGNLRAPVLHDSFGLDQEPGLAEVLSQQRPLSEVVGTTSCPGLQLLTAGAPHPNPGALLGSEYARTAWDELREAADTVIVDSPGLMGLPDALLMARLSEAGVVVLSRNSKRSRASEVLASLSRGAVRVCGVVMNGVRVPRVSPSP